MASRVMAVISLAVEVGMEAYLLALDASLVDHIHQGSRPLLVGQDFHGHHRGAAAGEADSLYVRYVQQPPGYLPEIISCQAEGVAAGNPVSYTHLTLPTILR